MFNQPPYEQPTITFWQRHHHDRLVDRWASIVGPERLLVIVVDESDPDSLMRTFEKLTDLPDGLLEPEAGWMNRSLTAAETELIRQLNVEFFKRKWPSKRYHGAVRRGVVRQMQLRAPGRDEPKITTPAWAIERANGIAAASSLRIKASGVHILGDLSTLSDVPANPDAKPVSSVPLTLDGAAHAVVGAIDAAALEWLGPPEKRPTNRRGRLRRRIKRRIKRQLGLTASAEG
jgi:hypothetical protein